MEGDPLVTAKQVFSIIALAALGVLLLSQPVQATPPEQMTVQFTGTPTIGYVPLNVSFNSNAWMYTAYSFARNSIAYYDNGTQVPANTPRMYDNGLFIEEGTTNLLNANQASGGDTYGNASGAEAYFGGAIVYTVETSYIGSGCFKVTCGANPQGGIIVRNAYSYTAGNPLSVQGRVLVPIGKTARVTIYGTINNSTNYSPGNILMTVTGNGEWQLISGTISPGQNLTHVGMAIGFVGGEPGDILYADALQVEQKPYATSWIGGGATRAAEVVSMPTVGILFPSQGTIEMLVNVTANIKNTASTHRLFVTSIAASQYLVMSHTTANTWNAITSTAGGDSDSTMASVSDTLISGIHRFAMVWNSEQLSLWIDGIKVATRTSPKLPSQLDTTAYIGSWSGTQQANTQIGDIVISNVARTDAEMANRGILTPLGVDQYTTAYMPLSGPLNATWWQWSFGDGSPNTTERNPYHVYSQPGIYTVTLTTGTGSSQGTLVRTGYVIVMANPINPDFSVTPQIGYTPLTVSGSHSGTNVTSWEWSWGDGSPNSTTQNPTHEYTQPGTYTITLTASNAFYSATMSKQVQVLAIPVTSSFTANVTEGGLPLYVQFTQSSVNATSWQWQFGDGSTSSEQNPAHLYTTAGRFTVKLTVSNTFSGDSSSTTVRVIAPDIFGPYNTSMRVPTFGGNGGGILQGIIDSIFPKDTDDFDLGTGLYYAGKPFSLNGIGDWWIVIVIITVAALILLSQGGSPFLLVMGLILGNAVIWVFIPMDWRSTIVVMATLTIAILILTLLRPGKER
jgi:PKD repeat protein